MIERIKKLIIQKHIDQVAMLFSDLEGNFRVKYVLPEELLDETHVSWINGISVDGSQIPGFDSVTGYDWLLIRPDLSRPLIFEWTMNDPDGKTLGFLCNIAGYKLDSRTIAQRTQDEFKKQGFLVYAGPKLCASIGKTESIGSYTPIPKDNTLKFRNKLVRMLMRMGIEIEYHYGKNMNSFDIDFIPKPFAIAADNIAIAKLASTELGKTMDIDVNFYGQPMHTHFSLWQKNENVFFDPKDKDELSSIGKSFIKGILKRNVYLNKFTNSKKHPNNFKKSWSTYRDNSAVLVPMYYIEKKKKDRIGWSKRCIYKNLYADSNQYLAFSSVVLAGMENVCKISRIQMLSDFHKATMD